ncbi:hypothetical protein [Thalassobius vesicularis]|uniref:hypothetical protein n=1 Tax=Thalassobius vesicularis TaxID=1294297 RepID=UPI001454DFC7|nr:hypothetical protein [Thalassobius vesicularis]
MRNARTQRAGHAPLTSGPADDQLTLRSMMSEAGLTGGIWLDWILDRIETPEAGQ